MPELIEAVKAWPVIVQGALGSALFWLVLLCGQYGTSKLSAAYSRHSKKARLSWLISAENKYTAATTDNFDEQVQCGVILIYRASRFLFKALMWLVMGIIFQELLPPIAIVGFSGCLYYLFKGYEIVSPIREGEDLNAELKKISKEIEELK